MTNQQFCYWLQGYLEIDRQPILTKEKVLLIDQVLKKVIKPLSDFTQWLSELFLYFETQQYNQALLTYFLPEISTQLSLIFYHVIDNTYDTDISHENRKKIHDGQVVHDKRRI
jgi:hypothetical protein